MSTPPSAIDLFCGAGGLSTGLQWAGFDIEWAIDHNEDATETFKKNHDGVDCVSDDVVEATLPDVESTIDLVAGGPPCPPFSLVGRSKLNSLEGRTAADDDRVQLWERLRDAVKRYEPQAFLMENVEGMVSATNASGGSVLKHICGQFSELGYTVRPQVVDAADFGVPQHRTRLLILGCRGDVRPPNLEEWRTHREPVSERERQARLTSHSEQPQEQQTLNEYGANVSESNQDEKPHTRAPWVTVAEAISDLPPLSPAGDRASDPHPPAEMSRYVLPPVTQYQAWAREDVHESDTEDGTRTRLHNHKARYHNINDLSIYSLLGAGTGWRIGDLPDELQPYRSDVFSDNYTKQRPDQPSSTITAHISKDGHMHIHPHEARSFTVREAARLQSFPDDFIFPGPRTAAYRQIGNAVPPLLAEAAGQALRSVLNDC